MLINGYLSWVIIIIIIIFIIINVFVAGVITFVF